MKLYNTIFFEDKIKKIKKEGIRNFLLIFFTFKNLIFRIGCFVVLNIVCGLAFFLIRYYSLSNEWEGVLFNRGFAYGIGNDWPIWLGYFVKILPFVILFSCLFLVNEWYIQLFINLIVINSLFNIIDKSLIDTYNGVEYYDAVVDNITWQIFGFTNNIGDIFIIIGAIGLIISYIYMLYLWYQKRENINEDTSIDNSPKI